MSLYPSPSLSLSPPPCRFLTITRFLKIYYLLSNINQEVQILGSDTKGLSVLKRNGRFFCLQHGRRKGSWGYLWCKTRCVFLRRICYSHIWHDFYKRTWDLSKHWKGFRPSILKSWHCILLFGFHFTQENWTKSSLSTSLVQLYLNINGHTFARSREICTKYRRCTKI